MAIFITILFGLLHGGLLAAAWRAARRLDKTEPIPPPPSSWPPVRVILPFAEASPGLMAALDDLAAQDYPNFEIHLVCHEADEPARAFVRAWLLRPRPHGGPAVQLVQAATARTCSQKNRNLLAGLGASGVPDQMLVFTDADYRRPPDWLWRLVAPVAAGERAVSSGYYHAAAGLGWREALRPVTALLLFLTRQHAALRHPWGGATAMARGLFDELGVAELWATRIVDDVALAERLRVARIPVIGLNAPALLAPAAGGVEWAWSAWFTRQLAYVRFIQPGSWVGIGFLLWAYAAGWLWMAMRLFVDAGGATGWLAALDGVLLTALGLRLHALHPLSGARGAWLAAYFAFWLAAPICYLRAAFSRTVHWRGIRYRVGRDGRVLSTSAKPGQSPEPTPEAAPPRQG